MQNIEKRIDVLLNSNQPVNDKLQKLCQLLYDELPNYDWVGFYFQDNNKKELHLGPYVGAKTDHTTIPFGKGICGQVAESNDTFLVDDVKQQDNYLACSIDTQSEIVVPIFKNGENIGQIDIDSHSVGAFGPRDKEFLEGLMHKVAQII